MQRFSFSGAAVLVLGAVLLSVRPAYAYLDPGTGSMVLQAITGAIFGGLVAMNVYWHKVKAFFSGAKSKTEKTSD